MLNLLLMLEDCELLEYFRLKGNVASISTNCFDITRVVYKF